ncbi:MAG: ATP phosphoribosyltransferase regulatory subunit [Clostridia bacterium]|nr:ATP phosphoribosyltransferase regulatory subunit [Clostridia bacterium]
MLSFENRYVLNLSKLYEKYGYMRFKMGKFEEYDTYVKNKSFLTSDNIITFTDTNGKLMALKPDVTLSIVKSTKDIENLVYKVYYNENVYRVSGETKSFKEIMQSGLECIGSLGEYEISEVIKLAREALKTISNEYVLDISHLGIISAVLDDAGISMNSKTRLLECFSNKNIADAENILSEEEVTKDNCELIKLLMACNGKPTDMINKLKAFSNESIKKPLSELETIISIIGEEGLRLDFSVVNDMRYYNGIVFQGFIRNIPKCVLFGGQYNLLLKKMRRNSKAIGFAIYLDELKEEIVDLDVDILVIYNEKSNIIELDKKVTAFREDGLKVLVEKTIPENLRYGKIIKL